MDSNLRHTGPFEIAPPVEGEFGLGDIVGRIGGGIRQLAGKAADALGSSAGIIDLTAKADKSVRKGTRDMAQVKALVLHQMACCHQRKDPLNSYLHIGAHFAILADGRILQLHPESALVWASNGFNHLSVAVEFAGNFPNTKGKWWEGDRYGRNQVTPAQIDAGRRLVRHLVARIGLQKVLAHRQSSASRENDPGPDIWYHVGQWAVDTLGLSDGGPTYKVGDGNPIPDLWRKWGRHAPAVPPGKEFEGELEDSGAESTLLARLIHDGFRDESKLSDRVFELRHPERAGRAITAEEPALAAEWLAIRNAVVRPALHRAGVTAVDVRPYRALLPLLEKHRGDAPLDFLLGWIAVESGGHIGSTTRLDERGYFQLHPDESKTLGVDHARLSTDADYSIEKGVALARFQANKAARQYGYPLGSALSWPLSKLLHWLPLGVKVIMGMLKRQGRRVTTWAELRSFVLANQDAIQKEITRVDTDGETKHRFWPVAPGIANVDKVLQRGREIALALGLGTSTQNETGAAAEAEFEQETAFGPLTATLTWLPQTYAYAAVAAPRSAFENFGGVYIAFLPAPPGGKIRILKVGMSDTFARRMRDAQYVALSQRHPGLSFYLAQVNGQRGRYGVAGVVRMVEFALARLLQRAGELNTRQLPNRPSAARGAVQITNPLPSALQALLTPALQHSKAGGAPFTGAMPSGQLALKTGFRWEAEAQGLA